MSALRFNIAFFAGCLAPSSWRRGPVCTCHAAHLELGVRSPWCDVHRVAS